MYVYSEKMFPISTKYPRTSLQVPLAPTAKGLFSLKCSDKENLIYALRTCFIIYFHTYWYVPVIF